MTQTVPVHLGNASYDIHIAPGEMARAGERLKPLATGGRVFILADEQVAAQYLPALQTSLQAEGLVSEAITFPGGERAKSFAMLESLCERLLRLKPDRNSLIVALGGGVCGDLAGFIASILLRGIPFVQIPTTLLAQVDSSVGGKTGINTASGKNLIGSFYQPKAVLIDTETLQSLPDREMRAGYAEIVKYGLLGDHDFYNWLETEGGTAILSRMPDVLSRAIAHCCRMKAEIVAQDEKEKGARALLNLGHTFAHALEAEAGYDGRLLHGEAVAIGLVMAARLSARLGCCGGEVEARIAAHLQALELPGHPADIVGVNWEADAICSHFTQDKKAYQGKLYFITLRSIGKAEVLANVPPDAAYDTVRSFLQ